MKILKYVFTLSLILFAANTSYAQENNDKYLAGAVPEVDGRVVFSELIHLPNVTSSVIFNQAEKWIESRYNSKISRVVYKDSETGMLVAFGNDTIVFKEGFLSLDRTIMTYQLKLEAKDGECSVQLEKINYAYGETDKFSAEEMISDKAALNKSKTKVFKGLQKWRYKTVDHVDAIFASLAESLAVLAPRTQQLVLAPEVVTEEILTTAPIIITDSPTIELPENIFDLIQNNYVTIQLMDESGEIQSSLPLQSVEIGKVFGKTTLSIMVPYGSEIYEALERSNSFTANLYDTSNGSFKNPILTISCNKMISQSITPESFTDNNLRKSLGAFALQKLYIGEIISVKAK